MSRQLMIRHTPSSSGSPVPSTKPRVALTLDQELYDQLKAIAAAERRPLANLIESWIVAELERRKQGG